MENTIDEGVPPVVISPGATATGLAETDAKNDLWHGHICGMDWTGRKCGSDGCGEDS